MNTGLPESDACYHYYDGDYPSLEIGHDRTAFETLALEQGIARDVRRYGLIAGATGGPILEIGCGTGRVTIPLARLGYAVTGVDTAPAMLGQLQARLAAESPEVAARITPVEQDATALNLPDRHFRLALLPFNGLMMVPDFRAQRRMLRAIRDHLEPACWLVLDVANPLMLPLGAQTIPTATAPRLNPRTGNWYTKFAMIDRMDDDQCQRLHGWYDEIQPDGLVRRSRYAFQWRLVFRFELELMLEACGFAIDAIQGGHNSEPFTVDSPNLFVLARKR